MVSWLLIGFAAQDIASSLLLSSSFGISVILAGSGWQELRRMSRSTPSVFSSSCSPQLAFVTRTNILFLSVGNLLISCVLLIISVNLLTPVPPGGLASFGISPVWPTETCSLPVEQPVGSHNQFHFRGITFTIRFRPGYFAVCVSSSGCPGWCKTCIRWRWFPPFIYQTQATRNMNDNHLH